MSSPQCERNAILVNGYSIHIDVVCPVVTARLKLAYNEQAWQTRITIKDMKTRECNESSEGYRMRHTRACQLANNWRLHTCRLGITHVHNV